MAKALSIALSLPLLGINHLKGHIYSLFIEEATCFPMDVLLVSGGHTQLLHVKSLDEQMKVREQLLKYSELDTLAMVRVLRKLKQTSKIEP